MTQSMECKKNSYAEKYVVICSEFIGVNNLQFN